jgi:hypothetical protein
MAALEVVVVTIVVALLVVRQQRVKEIMEALVHHTPAVQVAAAALVQ